MFKFADSILKTLNAEVTELYFLKRQGLVKNIL